MLWFDRPPYLRWAAAGLLVAMACWSEFGPTPSTDLWVATDDIPAGTTLDESLFRRAPVVWERPPPSVEPDGTAVVDIAAGDPLVSSLVGTRMVPDGWLVVAAPLPPGSSPGSEATVVLLPATPGGEIASVPAVVTATTSSDPFGGDSGTIAVPPSRLPEVVAATTEDRAVVAVATLER